MKNLTPPTDGIPVISIHPNCVASITKQNPLRGSINPSHGVDVFPFFLPLPAPRLQCPIFASRSGRSFCAGTTMPAKRLAHALRSVSAAFCAAVVLPLSSRLHLLAMHAAIFGMGQRPIAARLTRFRQRMAAAVGRVTVDRSGLGRRASRSGWAGQPQHVGNLRVKLVDNRLRIRHQSRIGRNAHMDFARVTEDAKPQANIAGARHPEHEAAQPLTRQIDRLARAGHVGHHRRDFGRKEIDHRVFRSGAASGPRR